MEARFADVDFARRAYSLIVKRIINSGVHETFAFHSEVPSFLNSDAVDNHLLLLWNVAP